MSALPKFPLRPGGDRARQVIEDYDRMRARIPQLQIDPAIGWTWPRVYVAAPFEEASTVRTIHRMLANMRYVPTSAWAENDGLSANVLESTEANRQIHRSNIDALLSSDLMIVKRVKGSGGEMFVEFERALQYGMTILWTGPPILSTYRDGVTTFPDMAKLMAWLEQVR